jgi:hypothetical protein
MRIDVFIVMLRSKQITKSVTERELFPESYHVSFILLSIYHGTDYRVHKLAASFIFLLVQCFLKFLIAKAEYLTIKRHVVSEHLFLLLCCQSTGPDRIIGCSDTLCEMTGTLSAVLWAGIGECFVSYY